MLTVDNTFDKCVCGGLLGVGYIAVRVGMMAAVHARDCLKGYEIMSMDTKTYVIELLESYQKRSKQIELLHYELSHPARVSANEMIGAMSLAHGDSTGHSGGHISDKTLYIALNYQSKAETANSDATAEVVEHLIELETEQNKLLHYISLLDPREARVIRLFYFEKLSWENIAKKINVAPRTAHRIKNEAIDALAEMYSFTGIFSMSH